MTKTLIKFELVVALLMALSNQVQAQSLEPVARVISAGGGNIVAYSNGVTRSVARRSEIFVGDTIRTYSDGMIQIRFADSALISLHCNSTLIVENYTFEDSNNDRSELRLVEGHVRTVTGSIQTSKYRFVTDVATIRVLGADFEVTAGSQGSYLFAVYDGRITLENSMGKLILGAGAGNDFARVEADGEFVPLATAPSGLGNVSIQKCADDN